MKIVFNQCKDLFGEDGFSKEDFKKTCNIVLDKAKTFREKMTEYYKKKYEIDLNSYVSDVNIELFNKVMIDAFEDLKRIKNFHAVDTPSIIKHIAYIAYWWIQRKPFQLINANTNIPIAINLDEDLLEKERVLFFNEYFCVYYVLSTIFLRRSVVCNRENEEEWSYAEEYLFYYFCYRSYTPKSIDAFLNGAILHPTWEVANNKMH